VTYFANSRISYFEKHRFGTALGITWLIGLISGACFSLFLKPSFFSVMRSAFFQPVSIVGLFASVFFPLTCSFFSILIDKPIMILIVCFIKAVAYGFSGAMISLCFDSASWLFSFLFLFSDSCFLIILFFLWFRRSDFLHSPGSYDFLLCSVLGLLIVVADYFVISPFLLGLF